jgi:hypothetical protein
LITKPITILANNKNKFSSFSLQILSPTFNTIYFSNHQIKLNNFLLAASNPGSKFHSFVQQNCYFGQQLRYFFGQQKLFFLGSEIIFLSSKIIYLGSKF